MRGFSTFEIVIALALMSLVFSGVLAADSGNTYWALSSQGASAGVAAARAMLGELRAAARGDFYAASSTAVTDSRYFTQAQIVDVSPCSKYADITTSWLVPGYATTSFSLVSALGNPAEAVKLGGDCAMAAPQGAWSAETASSSGTFSPGNPTAIDVLAGTAYLSTNQSPYLRIYKGGFAAYGNGFYASDPINALDVARSSAGKVYAYAAMSSTTKQFAVIDVTDMHNPVEVADITLAGVDPLGSSPQGWRLAYYDQKVYLTTRNTAGPELHIIDVSNPAAPVELGSGLNLSTSPYAIVVRDEEVAGVLKRFAYLATTLDVGEVMVVDATSPAAPSIAATFNLPDAGCGLSDKPDGTALFLSGHVLYVGRDHSAGSCPTLPDLYALDISNPHSPVLLASGVAGGGIIGLRASGGYLFAYVSTQASPTDTGLMDIDANDMYAAQHVGKELQIWSADPAHFAKLSSSAVGSASLQLFDSHI